MGERAYTLSFDSVSISGVFRCSTEKDVEFLIAALAATKHLLPPDNAPARHQSSEDGR
jgi:hypothetical protein